MRVLVLGAGATGGYFGGRLAQCGADVSFLVRPARARALAADGLRLRSRLGDVDLKVKTLGAEQLSEQASFDLVVLACKAYDLESAIEAIAPAVSADTCVLPLLNGLLHYPTLDARFGVERVLGGLCFIASTLEADGVVRHLGGKASMTFGLRQGNRDNGVLATLAQACAHAGIEHSLTDDIVLAQWIKYSFLCPLAAATCLMRASIGQIVASEGGTAFMAALHEECLAVAAAEGVEIPEHELVIARGHLTQSGSPMTASMLRDIQSGAPVEALQIVGDMVHRGWAAGLEVRHLLAAWTHLQAYQRNRGA